MCTSIVEIATVEGMARSDSGWFPVTHDAVSYDHARHALLPEGITIDFINAALPPGARAGVDLTLQTAKALHAALGKAIVEADAEEADRAESISRQQAEA